MPNPRPEDVFGDTDAHEAPPKPPEPAPPVEAERPVALNGDHWNGTRVSDQVLAERLRLMIRRAESIRPRSMQTRLGPSQIGNPCDRSLAYQFADSDGKVEHHNSSNGSGRSDPLAAIIGTSVHAWLDEAARVDNEIETSLTGLPMWKHESAVTIDHPRLPLAGSCDLYTPAHGVVLDWKVVGPTSYRRYTSTSGVAAQYRVQTQLYGLAYKQAGLIVDRVGVAVVPRNGTLNDIVVITEQFDEPLATAALDRAADLRDSTDWQLEATKPSHTCLWCPVGYDQCADGKQYR